MSFVSLGDLIVQLHQNSYKNLEERKVLNIAILETTSNHCTLMANIVQSLSQSNCNVYLRNQYSQYSSLLRLLKKLYKTMKTI